MKATVQFGSGSVRAAALALVLAASGVQAQSGPAKVDLAKGEAISSQVCVACHAADGNSPTPANPKLAGQHADYLYKQLMDFKVKQGAKEAARANAIMAGFAAGLSDEDMRNVSAYLSKQALKPAAAANKDIVELGQKIYRGGIAAKNVPACAGCHSPNGAGIPSQYPRLAGQYAEYTDAQLVAFRQGLRKNSTQMTDIAARMSDVEIKAVSEYIAGLR
ncbi:c-type cytochrome [Quisquiliibacterium transsilvanicum]|uniref:Cytochrome c553 n=1 Tax=Quisquiliibacterium transsilvanicum TaxID=1549638 RepID=A0A7W8M8J5_9BURK|nr:c-type cytochrome [Quisquiliibacterium transsilvanicum]MBB5271858.1 cytochrome c553 [Quisquiliibacterium transsilvanicum]